MKQILTATALTAAAALSAPVLAQDRAAERAAEYEAAFDELVEGREAGEPQSCITTFRSHRLRVVENVGITYERGDTLWVARVANPHRLSVWDVPVFERYGSQLCRHDVRRTVDRSTGMYSGAIFLSDFVPYTEVEDAEG